MHSLPIVCDVCVRPQVLTYACLDSKWVGIERGSISGESVGDPLDSELDAVISPPLTTPIRAFPQRHMGRLTTLTVDVGDGPADPEVLIAPSSLVQVSPGSLPVSPRLPLELAPGPERPATPPVSMDETSLSSAEDTRSPVVSTGRPASVPMDEAPASVPDASPVAMDVVVPTSPRAEPEVMDVVDLPSPRVEPIVLVTRAPLPEVPATVLVAASAPAEAADPVSDCTEPASDGDECPYGAPGRPLPGAGTLGMDVAVSRAETPPVVLLPGSRPDLPYDAPRHAVRTSLVLTRAADGMGYSPVAALCRSDGEMYTTSEPRPSLAEARELVRDVLFPLVHHQVCLVTRGAPWCLQLAISQFGSQVAVTGAVWFVRGGRLYRVTVESRSLLDVVADHPNVLMPSLPPRFLADFVRLVVDEHSFDAGSLVCVTTQTLRGGWGLSTVRHAAGRMLVEELLPSGMGLPTLSQLGALFENSPARTVCVVLLSLYDLSDCFTVVAAGLESLGFVPTTRTLDGDSPDYWRELVA